MINPAAFQASGITRKENSMETDQVLSNDDFKKCVDFHGHVCPGLAIGFRAANLGLAEVKEKRSVDEELVAVVENSACGVDAVQVLTGCTFGKDNFIHKDFGKHAFTFIGRNSGKGVRICMKPDVMSPNPRHRELMAKIREETATDEEKKTFWDIHQQRCREILTKPADELFTVSDVVVSLPPRARIEPSLACDHCGEPTMASRLAEKGGQQVCPGCLGGC